MAQMKVQEEKQEDKLQSIFEGYTVGGRGMQGREGGKGGNTYACSQVQEETAADLNVCG